MTPGTTRNPVLRYLRGALDAPTAESAPDADLLRRIAAARDEAAFELLMGRHAGMVLRVCRRVLRDGHAAEDAFQAAFLALARKAGSIGHESVGGWLYRVAYRAALRARLDAARLGDRAAREPERRPPPDAGEPGEAAVRNELIPLLHEELDRLAAKYRAPVVLCYLEGKTHTEAARQLGWPVGTVAGRLARARGLLRHRLMRRGLAPSLAAVGAALAPDRLTAVPPPLVLTTARAARALARGELLLEPLISPATLRLTQGVLSTMTHVPKRAFVAVALAAVAAALGTGVLVGRPAGRPAGAAGAAAPTPTAAAPAADSALGAAGEAADAAGDAPPRSEDARRRVQSINNLKQIALAFHNYHDVYGHFPSVIRDDQGEPLLSWRVAILPYIEQDELYKQFHLDESWDSEHNKKLIAKMPKIYATGTGEWAGHTYYQGFSGKGTALDRTQHVRMTDITDGTSNTILVVEAGEAVPWTKPEDLRYSPNRPLPKLGGPFKDVTHFAFCDGSVHTLRKDFDEKAMRAAITINGGEVFDIDQLHTLKKPTGAERGEGDGRVRDENAALIEEARRSAELARQLRAEVEQLRATRESGRTDAEAAQLLAEHRRLKDELRKLHEEVEALRAEVDRLKRGARRNP
jgi:RNA polymerase sigma factor (sigma-70 family)